MGKERKNNREQVDLEQRMKMKNIYKGKKGVFIGREHVGEGGKSKPMSLLDLHMWRTQKTITSIINRG